MQVLKAMVLMWVVCLVQQPALANPGADAFSLNDGMRVLAGLDVAADSSVQRHTKTDSWASISQELDKTWTSWTGRMSDKIGPWRNDHLSDAGTRPVFYPFSGPDILNAVTFFPDARGYTMFGLEPVGLIPDEALFTSGNVPDAMQKIRGALVELMGHNYFHTKVMAYKIGGDKYNGVAGILGWFLVRSGHEVVAMRAVTVSDAGVVEDHVGDGLVKGVEVQFRRPGGEVRKVTYFAMDISDAAWTKRPGMLAFLEGQGEVNTMLKAASYLMFRKSFDHVRAFILSRSRMILQDPSGLPFHHLSEDDKWDITHHGSYVGPIPLFEIRCQPDLKEVSAKESPGKLPFGYGYHRIDSVVVARLKSDRTISSPVYSPPSGGVATSCSNGRLVISR